MKTILCLALVFMVRQSQSIKIDYEFQYQCEIASNMKREEQGARPLKMDEEAQTNAEKRCKVIAQYENLKRDYKDVSGENIFQDPHASKEVISCKEAVENWYKGGHSKYFEHLVSKKSERIGCARCARGKPSTGALVVCHFTPSEV